MASLERLTTTFYQITLVALLTFFWNEENVTAVNTPVNPTDSTPTTINATLGRKASLPCHVDVKVDTGLRVTWHSPSGELLSVNRVPKNPRFKFDDRYPSEYTLINDEIREDEAGLYECRVTVNSNAYSVKRVQLIVNMPPRITYSSSDIEVASGSDVTMTCTVTGIPKPTVTWTLIRLNEQNKVLPPSGEIKKLTSVSRNDAGWYSCTADNNVQPFAETKIRLDVTFKPHVMIPYKEVHQISGSSALLECMATANPKGDLYWMRSDGTRLDNITGTGYRVRETASVGEYTRVLSLDVLDMDSTDFIVYTCYAKNNIASAFASVNLVEFNGTDPMADEVAQCQVAGGQASMSVVAGLATALGLTITAIIVTLYWFFVVKKFHHQQQHHRQPLQHTNPTHIQKTSNNHLESGTYTKNPDTVVLPPTYEDQHTNYKENCIN